MEEKAKIILTADTSDLDRVIRKIEKLNKHVEKANSLIAELASSDVEINCLSETKIESYNAGRHFLRGLRQLFCRI